MIRALRALGVAILITATLHATAGLCFCRPGPDAPAAQPGSHNCCHPADQTGGLAIGPIPICCRIDTAQRDMTPIVAVQLAPPSEVIVTDVADTACGNVLTRALAHAIAPSPPIQVLRL